MSSFQYNKSGIHINTTEKYILKITFDISRYASYQHTISFQSPVTEEQAIKTVEEFFSKPVDLIIFNKVKDDLFNDDLTINDYNIVGDFLGDCIFLETIDKIGQNSVILSCGS